MGLKYHYFFKGKYAEYESTIDELSSMIVNSLSTQKKSLFFLLNFEQKTLWLKSIYIYFELTQKVIVNI